MITKERVLEWIISGCDYNAGLLLLSETGRHKGLIRNITGRPHRYAGKLRTELEKAACIYGQTEKLLSGKTDPGPIYPEKTGPVPSAPKTKEPDDSMPEDVRRIIKEHSRLFNERQILHDSMASIPDDNAPENVEQRKKLSDHIFEHSEKIEALFNAKEEFYKTGKLPDIESLFKKPDPEPEKEQLSDDASELKKKKKNLQSANTKDQNLLEYQTEAKGEKPSPMPEGPKRLKIELRIQNRNLVIKQIDEKLIKLANEK